MGDSDDQATRAELKAVLSTPGRMRSLVLIATRLARGNDTAHDLINSACVKLLSGKTPWRGVAPKLALMRLFGCVAWAERA